MESAHNYVYNSTPRPRHNVLHDCFWTNVQLLMGGTFAAIDSFFASLSAEVCLMYQCSTGLLASLHILRNSVFLRVLIHKKILKKHQKVPDFRFFMNVFDFLWFSRFRFFYGFGENFRVFIHIFLNTKSLRFLCFFNGCFRFFYGFLDF